MVNKIKLLLKNYLFKGSFIILIGNLIGSFINYLYHLLMGKFLLPEQYGLLNSFISLSYFTGILSGALSLAIVNLISPLTDQNIIPTIKSLEKQLLKISFISWLVVMFIFPILKNFLHLNNFSIYLVFSFQIFFSLLMIIYQASLRAKLKFLKLALLGISGSVFRITSALILIFLGLKTIGALGGMLCSVLGVIILGRFLIFKQWQKYQKKEIKTKLKTDFWQYSGLSLITTISLISIYSSDVLLARHFFSSFESGIYSATSVLGKIIFFATNPIITVAFPLFTKYKKKPKKLKKIFQLSFLVIGFVSLLGVVFYYLFPNLIVSLLYNQNYNQAAKLLPHFAIFITFVALFTLTTHLLLSLNSFKAPAIAFISALIQIILINFNHTNLLDLIKASQFSIFLGLLLSLFFVIKSINGPKKQ